MQTEPGPDGQNKQSETALLSQGWDACKLGDFARASEFVQELWGRQADAAAARLGASVLARELFALAKEKSLPQGQIAGIVKEYRLHVLPHIQTPCLSHSIFLTALCKCQPHLDSFGGIVYQLGLERLGAADFERKESAPGQKPWSSLAESVAKALHESIKKKEERWCPTPKQQKVLCALARWIEDLMSRFPDNVYLGQYASAFYRRGGDLIKARACLEPLQRRLGGQAWVWDAVARCSGNAEERIQALARGLLCKDPESYKIKLYDTLALLWEEAGETGLAKAAVDRCLAIRAEEGWTVNGNLSALMQRLAGVEAGTLSRERLRTLAGLTKPDANAADSKSFVGVLKIPFGKPFGFVEDIFVAPHLIERLSLANGQRVAGTAKRKFDAKKGRDGWSAIRLTTAENKELANFQTDFRKKGGL